MCNCTSGNLEIPGSRGACHRLAQSADPLARPASSVGAERRPVGAPRNAALTQHCRIASRIVRGGGTVACRFKRQLAAGPVAQWLEPAAHNGLVPGSSPGRPTNLRSRSEQGRRSRRAIAGCVRELRLASQPASRAALRRICIAMINGSRMLSKAVQKEGCRAPAPQCLREFLASRPPGFGSTNETAEHSTSFASAKPPGFYPERPRGPTVR